MADTLTPAIPPELQCRAEQVLQLACDRECALATAESCTGGLLAALLTDIEGCSHIFERGFVTYSVAAKCDLLGLDRQQVEECGAVSREVAEAMAAGALRRSRAGLALAITGYAGPTGDGGEEGLVHFACASKTGALEHVEKHFGQQGRDGVRIAALDTALGLFESMLRT